MPIAAAFVSTVMTQGRRIQIAVADERAHAPSLLEVLLARNAQAYLPSSIRGNHMSRALASNLPPSRLGAGIVCKGAGSGKGGAELAHEHYGLFAKKRSPGVQFVDKYIKSIDLPILKMKSGQGPLLPEITLCGRSNVGKSSALNCLAYSTRKTIAVVSKTPGRTRTVNLYIMKDNNIEICSITDLPGYGYAKVSEEMQKDWRLQIGGYLRHRDNLKVAVVFVDPNVPPSEKDAQLIEFLEAEDVPVLVVATKTDKLPKAKLPAALQALRTYHDLPKGQPVALSSKTGEGRDNVWKALTKMCKKDMDKKKEVRPAMPDIGIPGRSGPGAR